MTVALIPDLPTGILGFVISGRLTRADYQEALVPPVAALIERGEDIRVLAVIEHFDGLEAGGLLAELKSAAKLGSSQRAIGTYFAVVSDTDWVRRSLGLFGRFVPGEMKVFPTARRAEAQAWLAAQAPGGPSSTVGT